MSTMDAQYAGGQNVLVRGWHAFTLWRRSRPFWAGLWTIVAALELWSIPFLQPLLVQHKLNIKMGGIAGVSTMAMTPVMIMMALTMWFWPSYRIFAAVCTLICALLSMVVSNFGGFLFGMLLGVLGGGLAFSWTPRLTDEQIAAQERAARAYRDALVGDMPASAKAPLGVLDAEPVDEPDFPDFPALARAPFGEAVSEAEHNPYLGVSGYEGARGEFAPSLPMTADAVPPANTLNQQRAADTSPTVPTVPPQTAPTLDAVPPLPSAEDTPLGA